MQKNRVSQALNAIILISFVIAITYLILPQFRKLPKVFA